MAQSLFDRFSLAVSHLDRSSIYMVGVSGGRDSVVLLHLLQAAGFLKLVVCHLNHNVRPEAVADCESVQRFCDRSNLRVIIETLPNDAVATEEAFRTARLSFFARTAAQLNGTGVFLGHHADDLAETFLWNLLRGSGMAGLSSLQPDRILETDAGSIRLLRPMLDIWRREIDDYAAANHLEFVEDASNASRQFTRNRLRHDILPWLEDHTGRSVRQNLHRAAAILAEENALLDSLVPKWNWSEPLLVAELQALPLALQRRAILTWLRHCNGTPMGFEEVEAVRSLLEIETGPARVNLPNNLQARRRAGKITLASQSG